MTISNNNMKYTLQYMRHKISEFRKLECVYRMQNNLNITHLKRYDFFIACNYSEILCVSRPIPCEQK